ncbi:hypothetical protein KY347_03995 [Candidatus Woesearchaeota archaeon]|nr:hypothetical protein [Candidatus Woesearchaeota archaeon]
MKIGEVIGIYSKKYPDMILKLNDSNELTTAMRLNNKERMTQTFNKFKEREQILMKYRFFRLKRAYINDGTFVDIWGIKKERYTKEMEDNLDSFVTLNLTADT